MKKFKLLGFIAILLISIISISACGGNKNSSDAVDDEKMSYYITLAQEVITMFNEQNTDDIQKISTEDVKAALTEETLDAVYEQIKNNGEFEEFLENETTTVDEKGTKLYVVVQKAKYSEKELIFTISFNEAGDLAGIYFK